MATKAKKKSITEENIEVVQEEQENSGVLKTHFIPTGDIGFDMAISNGKGIPVGGSILIWAEPACGKTTLIADMCKRLLKNYRAKGEPFKILYIDVEGSRDLLDSIGLEPYVDKELTYIDRSVRWRQVGDIYDKIVQKKSGYEDFKLVIIDSVNYILSDSNEEKSIADAEFGTKAKERSNFYSKYLPKCREAGVTSIFISQARQNQGAGLYAEKVKSAVSYADKHSVDVIMKCVANNSHTDSIKEVAKTACGEDKTIDRYIMSLDATKTSCKNRFGKTYRCEVMVDKGVGIQNFYILRKLAVYHGFINEASGYYSFVSPLLEYLGVEDKKYRKADVHRILDENVGKVVRFLKEHDCYSMVSPDQVKRVPGDEDTDNDEE